MICLKCGRELQEGQFYCPYCGNPVNNMQPRPRTTNQNRMHCPQCGNDELQMITDNVSSVQTSGGGYSGGKGCLGFLVFGPFGLLCGNCGSGSTTTVINDTKHFWTCNRCGYRFKDFEDYRKEISALKTNAKLMIFGLVLCTVLSILLFGVDKYGEFDWVQVILWLGNVIYVIGLVVSKSESGRKERELDELIRKTS